MQQPILTTCLFLFFMGTVNLEAYSLEYYSPVSVDTMRKDLKWFNAKDTIAFAPICGVDGKTYLNPEEAKFFGVNRWSAGSCFEYKEVISVSPEHLWISEVEVNEFTQPSNFTAQGYTKFTNIIFDVYKHQVNQFSFKNNSQQARQKQVLKVWIDYNSNGKFEPTEIVIDKAVSQKTFSQTFSIPPYLDKEFMTRMRVFYGNHLEKPTSGFIEMGEVEDYTIMVMD